MVSQWEEEFARQLSAYKINYVRELRFIPTRRFRFDFAIPELMMAIEIEGGIYHGGRHTSIKGMESDMEKYNLAASKGWRVFRFSTGMVKNGSAIIDTLLFINLLS